MDTNLTLRARLVGLAVVAMLHLGCGELKAPSRDAGGAPDTAPPASSTSSGLGLFCGAEVRLGAACSSSSPMCILPSLGGVCICTGSTYLCPLDTKSGPKTCPAGSANGQACNAPLTVCLGGGASACICGLGSYNCF